MNYGFAMIMFSFTGDLEQDDCNDKKLSQGTEDLFSLVTLNLCDLVEVVQPTSCLHLSSSGKWDYTSAPGIDL